MLVNDMRHELEGEEETPFDVVLRRFWTAFRIAGMGKKAFGERSFGWLALGGIFEVIKDFEEQEKAGVREYVHFLIFHQRGFMVCKLTTSYSA